MKNKIFVKIFLFAFLPFFIQNSYADNNDTEYKICEIFGICGEGMEKPNSVSSTSSPSQIDPATRQLQCDIFGICKEGYTKNENFHNNNDDETLAAIKVTSNKYDIYPGESVDITISIEEFFGTTITDFEGSVILTAKEIFTFDEQSINVEFKTEDKGVRILKNPFNLSKAGRYRVETNINSISDNTKSKYNDISLYPASITIISSEENSVIKFETKFANGNKVGVGNPTDFSVKVTDKNGNINKDFIGGIKIKNLSAAGTMKLSTEFNGDNIYFFKKEDKGEKNFSNGIILNVAGMTANDKYDFYMQIEAIGDNNTIVSFTTFSTPVYLFENLEATNGDNSSNNTSLIGDNTSIEDFSYTYYYGNDCTNCVTLDKYLDDTNAYEKLEIIKKEVRDNSKNNDDMFSDWYRLGVDITKAGVPCFIIKTKVGEFSLMGDKNIIEYLSSYLGENSNLDYSPDNSFSRSIDISSLGTIRKKMLIKRNELNTKAGGKNVQKQVEGMVEVLSDEQLLKLHNNFQKINLEDLSLKKYKNLLEYLEMMANYEIHKRDSIEKNIIN